MLQSELKHKKNCEELEKKVSLVQEFRGGTLIKNHFDFI